ncbi:SH3 domain-containing protein [Streptomyces sp. NPDC002132]|uniref:SH3 domain-containing protein n=1 Tax=unclassified Streptomyces TaxID=2593676 RepID=UPI00332F01EB
MSLRTAFTRLAIITAAGALASAAVVTPAGADDGFGSASDTGSGFASGGGGFDGGGNGGNAGNTGNPGNGGGGRGDNGNGNGNNQGGRGDGNGQGGRGDGNGQGGQGNNNGGNNQGGQGNNNGGTNQGNQAGGHRLTGGVVTTSQLLLHSAPTRGSQVIRVAHRGQVVSIYCKTVGQPVQGNRYWYLLTDGTWAWGAARYIDTRGSSPRWC